MEADPTLSEQIQLLESQLAKSVLDRTKALLLQFNDAELAGACIAVSESGACLQWSAKGIYCEIFDLEPDMDIYYMNVFSPANEEQRIRFNATVSSAVEAAQKLKPFL